MGVSFRPRFDSFIAALCSAWTLSGCFALDWQFSGDGFDQADGNSGAPATMDECIGANDGSQCGTEGFVCEAEQCICKKTQCGDECVDISIDPRNCGTCGGDCSPIGCCGGICVDLMLDPTNCGLCGHSCLASTCQNGEGCCQNGSCKPFIWVDNQDSSCGVVTDGKNIYWTSFGQGRVFKAQIDGTNAAVPVLLAASSSGSCAIAVDDQFVYWVNWGSSSTNGSVMKVPIAGGDINVLASNVPSPQGIAIDSERVYWTNVGDGTVVSTSKSGGPIQVLANGQTFPTGVIGSNATFPQGIAVDDTWVYWTTGNAGNVVRTLKYGPATSTVLAQSQAMPYGVAVHDQQVYWTNYAAGSALGTVMKLPSTGGTPSAIATAQSGPFGIAVDSNGVYWTNLGKAEDYENCTIMKTSLTGDGVVTLASTQSLSTVVATDSTSIYWLNHFFGATVVRLVK